MTLRIAAVVLVAVGLGMLLRFRGYDIHTVGAQAIWNKDDLYVFVTQNKSAFSQNLWEGIWSSAKALLGLATEPDFFRLDSLVYHVTNTSVEEYLVKGLSVTGQVAPVNGLLYAFFGGPRDRGGGVYRWTGRDFARLSLAEEAFPGSGFANEGDQFQREGWLQGALLR